MDTTSGRVEDIALIPEHLFEAVSGRFALFWWRGGTITFQKGLNILGEVIEQ